MTGTDWKSDILVNPYVQECVENLIIPGATLNAYGSGLSTEDIETICADLNTASCHLLDFLDEESNTDLESALDAVEESTKEHGNSMDSYLDNAIANLEGFLENPEFYLTLFH